MKKTCSKTSFPIHGFTLIELLIAISITAILFSIGVAQYIKFNRQQILNQAVLELKTNLTQARNMALAGKKTCSGTFDGILVEFSSEDSYTLKSSCDDKTNTVDIEYYEFSQGVTRTAGPTDILFKFITGGTDLDSDETIRLTDSGGNTGRVKVAPSGKIELVE